MTTIGPYVVVLWTLSRLVLVRKDCEAAFLLYSQSNMVEQAVTCSCVHQSPGHRACRVQLTSRFDLFCRAETIIPITRISLVMDEIDNDYDCRVRERHDVSTCRRCIIMASCTCVIRSCAQVHERRSTRA